MSNPTKAQYAIGPRCQKCKSDRKGCSRTRPCTRCCDMGLGYDECVPSVDLRKPPSRVQKPMKSQGSTHVNGEDEDIVLRKNTSRVGAQHASGAPRDMASYMSSFQTSNTNAVPRDVDIPMVPESSLQTTATAQDAVMQSNFNIAQDFSGPATDEDGSSSMQLLRSSPDISHEIIPSWHFQPQHQESYLPSSGTMDPHRSIRHHLQESKYFTKGPLWFEKSFICKDCEARLDQHEWWCPQF